MFRQILNRNAMKAFTTIVNNNLCKFKTSLHCFSQISCFSVAYANANGITLFNKEYETDLKRATKEGENYLSQLICMLRTVILETSIAYQECLIKQIELTKQNTQIGPIGEHWDQLTNVRMKGNELKDELTKYEALAKNIGEIIVDVGPSMFFGQEETVLKKLNTELDKLTKLCNEQLQEIHRYEAELLEAKRDSILAVEQ